MTHPFVSNPHYQPVWLRRPGIDKFTGLVIFVRPCEDLPEVRNCALRLSMRFPAYELYRRNILADRPRHRRENAATAKLPVAAIPRLFGVHQMTHRFSSSKESKHGMAL